MQNFRFHAWVSAFLGQFLVIFLSFFYAKILFFAKLGGFLSKKKKSCKTSVFPGLGALFGTFFSHFFVIFSCKISVFCGAGRSFWLKNCIFFHAKLQVLRGWVVFLVNFLVIFVCKTSVLCEAGRSSWVKNTIFVMQNFSFCGAGWYFWYRFLSIFCPFFLIE